MFRPARTFPAQVMNPVHASLTMAHAQVWTPEERFFHPMTRHSARVLPLDHPRFAASGLASSAVLLAQTRRSGNTADVALEDWDVLMSAVKERLRVGVSERLAAIADSPFQDTVDQVRSSVLECIEALDQLQTSQQRALSRRQRLELELFDARTCLAQARAELAGTQAQERHALHLARHDSLTALPNRRFFGERLAHALTHAAVTRRPLAVLYLDLDAFKPVNDSYGHAIGDDVLRIVAARLTQTLRAQDVVGRLGGDEFACLLWDLSDRAQLDHLACKLLDAVSAPIQIDERQLTVRPSIGIVVCPAAGATGSALLKNADAAMYRAKREQTGHAFFDACTDGWAHQA